MASNDDLVDLKVEISGGPHAHYSFIVGTGEIQVSSVTYPDELLPADLCIVANTLTTAGTPLGALLLGTVSHPPGCFVPARLLGAVETAVAEVAGFYLVAVAVVDSHFAQETTIADLSHFRRHNIEWFLRRQSNDPPAAWRWLDRISARQVLHQTRQAFRLAQAASREGLRLDPAWKPLHNSRMLESAGETERHSTAEYAYNTLPARFREYIASDLAMNERILVSLHRPALRSGQLPHVLFRRGKRLEEAVFIVGDQQVTEVSELMPPDRAGIRYGFVARGGAPERLNQVELMMLTPDIVGLTVTWRASGGEEKFTWEFPVRQRDQLEGIVALLSGWLPQPDDKRLRRATPPDPPEEHPLLTDPGANDPADTRRLAERLLPVLDECLRQGENVLARCLLPAWIKSRGAASLLAVTNHRLLVIPDPEWPEAERLRLALPLHAITSFEFSSTLLRAYLKVFAPDGGQMNEHVIHFGATLEGMDELFRVFRRALAATPPAGHTPITPQFAKP